MGGLLESVWVRWVAWIGLNSMLKDGLNFDLESMGCLSVWVWVFFGFVVFFFFFFLGSLSFTGFEVWCFFLGLLMLWHTKLKLAMVWNWRYKWVSRFFFYYYYYFLFGLGWSGFFFFSFSFLLSLGLGDLGTGKEKRKKSKKKSCTEWQVWEPQTVWKILSDGKWVMVPNEYGILKWWVISEEWWVMSDEWWVTEIKWWKKVIQTASKGSNDSLKWQSLESSLVKC